MTLAAANAVDYHEVLLHLFLDLVAIGLLTAGIFLRRHLRRDLVTVFVTFNVGLFAVVSVISTRHISVGLGFGLFAVLSIIRLRSEPYDNVELGYFFLALVLALVDGLRLIPLPFAILLDVLVLTAMFVVDHPVLHMRIRRRGVRLDEVHTNVDELRATLTERFGGLEIVEVTITEIDYVRETTDATVRYVDRAR